MKGTKTGKSAARFLKLYIIAHYFNNIGCSANFLFFVLGYHNKMILKSVLFKKANEPPESKTIINNPSSGTTCTVSTFHDKMNRFIKSGIFWAGVAVNCKFPSNNLHSVLYLHQAKPVLIQKNDEINSGKLCIN
jgi:hypothetical protein